MLLFLLIFFMFINNFFFDGYLWGKFIDLGINFYVENLYMGVMRYYDFIISCGFIVLDGYECEVFFVNGVFFGFLIEVNWGDMIVVNVRNNIINFEDGMVIYWYGFL